MPGHEAGACLPCWWNDEGQADRARGQSGRSGRSWRRHRLGPWAHRKRGTLERGTRCSFSKHFEKVALAAGSEQTRRLGTSQDTGEGPGERRLDRRRGEARGSGCPLKGQTKAWLIGWVRDGREEGHGCHGVGGAGETGQAAGATVGFVKSEVAVDIRQGGLLWPVSLWPLTSSSPAHWISPFLQSWVRTEPT